MLNGVLDNFVLPDGAAEALSRHNLQKTDLNDGVSRFISGHDKGVAFRFWIHPEYNKDKSLKAHYEAYDEIEMIEWNTDRFCKPTERVSFLPPELLEIDPYTHEARGRFAEAYTRFKKGLSAPGTSLSKWGVLTDGEIATLADNGVFSVEQFAAMPRSKVESKFPQAFQEHFERAIQFVNGKENRYQADKQAEEMLALQRTNSKLENEIAALQEQMTLLAQEAGGRVKRGKVKKIKKVEEDDSILS